MIGSEAPATHTSSSGRPGWVRWAVHGVAGALVLVVASQLVGLGGFFFIDEAAMYAQVDVLDGGGWTIPRPLPGQDLALQHVPMANAHITEDGYAPFAGHPLHVVLASGLHRVVGDGALRLMSAIGVLAAAAGAAALADRRRPTPAVAFWTTLLATPLLFHAQLVLAHGPGAALAAALFLAMARIRRTPLRFAVVVLVTAVGVSFRSEFLLLAAAVGLVYGIDALRRRRIGDLVLALGVVVSAGLVYRLEPRVVEALVGGQARPRGLPSTSGAREGAGEVLAGVRRALLDIGSDADSMVARMSLVAAVVLSLGAIVCMGARVPDRGIVRLLSVAALAAAGYHLTDAHLVRGIVWAAPVLVLLLPVVLRKVPVPAHEARRLQAVAVFAILLFITQYSGGGGPEWGWRYSAIAIPVVVPTLARVLVWLWQRAPLVPREATAALAATFVLVTVSGIVVQERQVSDTVSFLRAAERSEAAFGADYVVFTDPSFGRLAYTLALDGGVAHIDHADAAPFLRQIARDGVDRVLLVWRGDEPLDLPLGPFVRTDDRYAIDSLYQAVGLVRS